MIDFTFLAYFGAFLLTALLITILMQLPLAVWAIVLILLIIRGIINANS